MEYCHKNGMLNEAGEQFKQNEEHLMVSTPNDYRNNVFNQMKMVIIVFIQSHDDKKLALDKEFYKIITHNEKVDYDFFVWYWTQ